MHRHDMSNDNYLLCSQIQRTTWTPISSPTATDEKLLDVNGYNECEDWVEVGVIVGVCEDNT